MCKFWVPKWGPKWAKMAMTPHSDFLPGFAFCLTFFFMFFFRFWSSLGASWEPSWASWGSLGRPQERKNADSPPRKPLFWKCSFFGLWSSGPKMGPKMGSKRDPKSDQKMVHKIIQKLKKIRRFWGRTWHIYLPNIALTETFPGLGKMFFRRCFQDGFKIAQDSFKQPKIDPRLLKNRSKLAQTWTRGAPRSQP